MPNMASSDNDVAYTISGASGSSDSHLMSPRLVLEICVESVDHAVAAERGGAQRIELCSDLPSGGITPSAGLMQTVRRRVSIPIHVLIRPRPGDFCYSDSELEIMRNDILAARQFGMDGVVLGVLRPNAHVDIERTRALVELARTLTVTFHRAFDDVQNLDSSLEDVIQTGASRVLTSGGEARATDALSILARLVQAARDRIVLMPCGGINSENIVQVIQKTRAQEVHTSAGTSNPNLAGNGDNVEGESNSGKSGLPVASFEEKVAKLVSLLESAPHSELAQ
jgi:copper homeostasis protein